MDSNPIHHPSSVKKWNGHFWIMFNFWWLAWLVDELKPHLPPLSSQKNEMLIFGLCSTSDDWLGWLMDSNPIHHPSLPKKMKCSFLDYVQLQMIGWAAQLTWTPSTTPLQPKTWNACFCITFNIWCWPDWSMDSNPICHPLQPKNEMFIFGLCSTSDDWPGWSMDSNPIHHPSPAQKMKCSFLDYVQLLMIGQAGRWTRTPSATPLQPIKWNAHFCITINFWFRPDWSMDSNPIHHPSPTNKMKCSFLDYAQLLMISRAGWWTQTPSTTPLYPKKWNAHFWIMFNFRWLAELLDWLEPHPPPLSSQKHEMLVFV